MKTFTSEMFECVFCNYSSPVTVRAESNGVQRALASARCPQCGGRFARGPVFAALAGVGIAIVTSFILFALLLRAAVGVNYRGHTAAWAGNWMFVVALVAGAIVGAVSYVRARRDLGDVVFVALPGLPRAVASFTRR
jgi:hypothetical protein